MTTEQINTYLTLSEINLLWIFTPHQAEEYFSMDMFALQLDKNR